MPVLLCGVGISLDVSDELRVRLGRRVKAKGALDVIVLQVAVDGLRAADDLYADMIRRKILGQDSRIRVGIVAADDDNRCKAMLLSRLGRRLELLRSLNLCSARTDDIKPACVAVCIDEGVIKFNAVVVNQSARAALEAEQDILPVRRLQRVIQTGDDIMSARCLAAGENDTNNLLFRCGCIGSLSEIPFLSIPGSFGWYFSLSF